MINKKRFVFQNQYNNGRGFRALVFWIMVAKNSN